MRQYQKAKLSYRIMLDTEKQLRDGVNAEVEFAYNNYAEANEKYISAAESVDLAEEALRLVSRAWDGRGQPTLLTELVLSELGFQTVEEMITRIYEGQLDCYPGDFDQRRVLSLVPLVFEAAELGDRVARDLLVRVGTEVGTTANAVIKRLGLETTDVQVVLGGGVFRGPGSLLLDTVTESIHQVAPRATIVLPQFEPVVGAVLLALEALGIEIDEAVYANLRSSLASVPAPARGPQTTGPG